MKFDLLDWSIFEVIFYTFSGLAVLSGSQVIFSKNPVRAVLFLVLTFFIMSGIWLLLEAEFLAMTLILVYVGAVMVLFLFVVMMLDVDLATVRSGFTRYLPLGLLVSLLVVAGLIYAVTQGQFGNEHFKTPEPSPATYNQVKQLGELLYTYYVYPFEIAGILLLVAIVAAISLTFRGKRGSLAIDPEKQVQVTKKDRLRIVKF